MKIHKTIKNPKSIQRLYLPKKAADRLDGPSAHRGTADMSVPVYELGDVRQSSKDRARGELFSRARMQWQFGDWDSLGKLDLLHIEHHPERAELALLAGCAALQVGDNDRGRTCLTSALEWGCDRYLIFRLLISGVYNTLGRYHALTGNEELARKFIQFAGTGLGGDPKLIGEVRQQKEWLGLPELDPPKPTGRQLAGTASTNEAGAGPSAKANEFSLADVLAEAASDTSNPFKPGIRSYAQNFEDVMLWRALGHIENGLYIDIGAQHPVIDSVSKAFYERGWRGIHVEATHAYAKLLRHDRPDEIVIEAAVSDHHGYITFYEIPETGISTGEEAIAKMHAQKGFPIREITIPTITLADVFAMTGGREIHWLKIDVEGMESKVLDGWREASILPWVIVVESTIPISRKESFQVWEPFLFEKGYSFAYLDGLSRFYISSDHPELKDSLTLPPNVFDQFSLHRG